MHDGDSLFANWNAHFTPRWLSEKLVAYLPATFSGTVVDPACGAGNLLIAAARHLRADTRSHSELRFLGIDVSKRAVRSCETSLARIVPRGSFLIELGNFLTRPAAPFAHRAAVVMNPPFRGYGRLSASMRRRIIRLLDMRGRFNLSYAFVEHAITVYRPEILVSLLPSNWVYSRRGSFRARLNLLGGHWDWLDVGHNVFPGLSVDVGILVWHSRSVTREPDVRRNRSLAVRGAHLEVRHGVATGRDASFAKIADNPPAFGRIMCAVRGRDIDRQSFSRIWVPLGASVETERLFREHVDRRVLKDLRSRSCVRDGRRRIFEFHDPVPAWMFDAPKLLIPEIVVRRVRVELDAQGDKLPLHSVIAVRVPSVEMGQSLRSFLLRDSEQKALLAHAPRLAGGAGRMQVGAIRDAISRWTSTPRE